MRGSKRADGTTRSSRFALSERNSPTVLKRKGIFKKVNVTSFAEVWHKKMRGWGSARGSASMTVASKVVLMDKKGL